MATCLFPLSVSIPSDLTSNFQHPIEVRTSSEFVPCGLRSVFAVHAYLAVPHEASNAPFILLNVPDFTKEKVVPLSTMGAQLTETDLPPTDSVGMLIL